MCIIGLAWAAWAIVGQSATSATQAWIATTQVLLRCQQHAAKSVATSPRPWLVFGELSRSSTHLSHHKAVQTMLVTPDAYVFLAVAHHGRCTLPCFRQDPMANRVAHLSHRGLAVTAVAL